MSTHDIIDPVHANFDFFSGKMTQDIWAEKYRWVDPASNYEEKTFYDSIPRIVKGVFAKDMTPAGVKAAHQIEEFMRLGLWMPAGRILGGAGTTKVVTLLNCFVNEKLEDNMLSITTGLKNIMLTMQQGGGIGTDFSPLRPARAILKRTGHGSRASGPLPFMDTWNAGGITIESAGGRRGAQMGTLADTHPDLPAYIVAKQTPGRLTNFNISILVSDALMEAVDDDADWPLFFHVPPADERDQELIDQDFIDDDGTPQYVYSVWKARELWELITRNTYEWSEPGVIFIDRVNELNNLHYCETISCTNPCVVGNTLILTDQGHQPIEWLVGNETRIWNGEQWSTVTPFSTGINPTLDVTFSNGQTVRCTPYHKWVLADGRTVEARNLKGGDKLIYTEMPTILGGATFDIDAYSQGFYCGDGTKNAEHSNLYKHNEGIKARLIGKYWNRNCAKQPGVRWVHGQMLPKDFVPVAGSAEYCVNWLAGLLDADGTLSKKHSGNVLEISAKNRDFLRRVGLMLNRLGVNYRMWERTDAGLKTGSNGRTYYAENTAALMISWKGAHQLLCLGMKCERVDLSSFQMAPQGVARVGHRVLSVVPAPAEETFCFNEPLRNMGVYNGVIGHNCGEQPLPPNNACDLGHVVLPRMVRNPFKANAYFDFDLLREVVKYGMRFLDNIWDVTNYPLEQQREECLSKRRTGLGFTGLADTFAEMGMRYGSARSADLAERITQTMCEAAYDASVDLAVEKGAFPLFDADKYLAPNTFAGSRLPQHLQDRVRKYGIRNSVLLTVAPTGTSSIVYGNPQGGIEPFFALEQKRKVLKGGNVTHGTAEYETYTEYPYAVRLWRETGFIDDNDDGGTEYPPHFNTMSSLSIHDHILIQSRCQRWIDASISKTTNIPKDMPYEEFVKVYDIAYNSGCKGCTTYRPSAVRGSILEDARDTEQETAIPNSVAVSPNTDGTPPKRPIVLQGATYQIKWPRRPAAYYITINSDERGVPYELFIISKDGTSTEWTTALSLMITAIFKKGGDVDFVADELQQIQAINDGAFLKLPGEEKGRFYPSLPAFIGHIIEHHLATTRNTQQMIVANDQETKELEGPASTQHINHFEGEVCPECRVPAVVRQEGCLTCRNCGWSKC